MGLLNETIYCENEPSKLCPLEEIHINYLILDTFTAHLFCN